MLNMFAAVILDNFVMCADMGDLIACEREMNRFCKVWKDYDLENNGYVAILTLVVCLG